MHEHLSQISSKFLVPKLLQSAHSDSGLFKKQQADRVAFWNTALAYLRLGVVRCTQVEVSSGCSSNEVQLDGRSVVASVQWMNEAPQHGNVVRVDAVLGLERRHKLKVDARRSNYVHLEFRQETVTPTTDVL